jgi:hypothetical protein
VKRILTSGWLLWTLAICAWTTFSVPGCDGGGTAEDAAPVSENAFFPPDAMEPNSSENPFLTPDAAIDASEPIDLPDASDPDAS